MEQHPIPRQITTFEFKLIGFMTLKQFMYLLIFCSSGFVVFKLFPIPIVNIILGVMIGAIGAAFAFLPVNERPLDVWIKNLFKRLNSPTQYTFHKDNKPLYFLENLFFITDPHKVLSHIESKEKLAAYLQTTQPKKTGPVKKSQIHSLLRTPTAKMMPAQPVQNVQQVPQAVVQSVVDVSPPVPEQIIPREVQDIREDQAQPAEPMTVIPEVNATSLQDAVPAETPAPMAVEPPAVVQAPPAEPVVPAAPAAQTHMKNAQLPFFTGIVKNNRQIPLPGILVYVKDEMDKPIRLLKTNPHGVFATYNPLPSGEYMFEVKDPNGGYFFDTMKLQVPNLENKPFELYSKEMI